VLILETHAFTRRIVELLSDEHYAQHYAQLQADLVARPDAGRLIRGTGGLRKIRWAAKGHGKLAAFGSSTTGTYAESNC